ncbi:Na+/H+ antiporter NhaA [Erythrobacter litoralis]|uniref:Na(+)/H(+) antiporter NhaA 2 n=1 Tax=Erythrobacter litoralis (strain HTCC2594) TaxID=314225 RepID=NHAA2_ERYLH|nr:Na+/H+ antiporter NhaA [Erythrobacter litoralis]Q2NCP2.1 RecName: Full=Na(+)/H(+) antiporter NhaA 2; AltName: Full=Sodium/proton antiporter NhaA 2 [Erythrobacter litoralis HTCC2594]ABC62549.1 putative Na+/H+ antiporter protein [Erythrobacter litoralis HTCC2594]
MFYTAATALRDFLKQESAGGIVLMFAAVLALIFANTALADTYFSVLATEIAVTVGGGGIEKPALLWINDGLMAVFFFLVGLEVKREVLTGQLSSWKQASLPLIAAFGGIVLPALVFYGINSGTPENLSGWAIPAATDIAFALGILALLGKRVPVALKALLLAIAVIDDIAAIAIIAIFYTPGVELAMLGAAAITLLILSAFGRAKAGSSIPYIVLGIVLWYFVLKSGVHATLAGVALAMTVPLIDRKGNHMLEHMEHALHSWVAFLVVPIFALANAGVSFEGVELSALFAPLPLGIALGLIVGKQVGIFGFAWLAVKTGFAQLPSSVGWLQVWGLSLVAGIGFTMSLFIGNLAFADPAQINAVKIGVLSGSLIAALVGIAILVLGAKAPAAKSADERVQAPA